jgi:large subunit ribosomal protein L22
MAATTETAQERAYASATLRYLRSSPQKVRLVVDQVRGKAVTEALGILAFSSKVVAKDLTKCLRSAVANAAQHDIGELEDLVVARAWVDGGPGSLKHIRPAPMGRAYRYVHRTSHVTFQVESLGERRPRKKAARPAEGKAAAKGRRPAARAASKG